MKPGSRCPTRNWRPYRLRKTRSMANGITPLVPKDNRSNNCCPVPNQGYNRVVGIGVIASEYLAPTSKQNPIRNDETTHRHHVRLVTWLITEPVHLPGSRFFVQSTLWPLEKEKLDQ